MQTWTDVIGSEKEQDYFKATLATVRSEREAGKVIYPPATDVFNAFKLTELDQVKVVILGQDPYHGPNQAHGLCFSVLPGVRTPPSLVNIYKEMQRDLPGFVTPSHGFLESWAKQGVLLLNTVLTVQGARPGPLPCPSGLGDLHRPGHRADQCQLSGGGLPAVGRPCPEEGALHRQATSSRDERAAPQPALCSSRLHRLRPFLRNQPAAEPAGDEPHQLALGLRVRG